MNLIVMCLANLAAAASPLSASPVQQAFDSCRPRTETCTLPEYPANGTYNVLHIPEAKPGDTYDLVIINVTCRDGFVAEGSTYITCFNGWWQNKMPKCAPRCHLPSHASVVYNCRVFGAVEGTRECNVYEPSGTVVSPQCRPAYSSTTALTDMRCTNHAWDYVATCVLECGILTSSAKPLIAGGVSAKHGEISWHAGIYTKEKNPYLQICGGSLISTDVVLSAAHCFWSNEDTGAQKPAASFAVAVGKLYRPWNDDMDQAQTSDVKVIHLPARFQGSAANFQDDIAVVIVTKPFEYKWFIRPVCVDFDVGFEERQLQSGKKGKVAGWGRRADGTASPVLQVVELPYVNISVCISESPPSFEGSITSDKICAGFRDDGKAVCQGDSGGGLAFPDSDKGRTRYFLRGVVSTAPPSNDLCNVNEYTTFTRIQSHEVFIKKFWIAEGLSCKEETLAQGGFSPWYSLDDVSLLHFGTLRRDSAGRLAYLELRLAVQAYGVAVIHLSVDEDYSGIYYAIIVGGDSNQHTYLWYKFSTVQGIPTPNILSATQFRSFYMKVDDGKLQFGKEGDAPLISHSIIDVGVLKYYRFSAWYGSANIRICPTTIEGSS